MSKIKFNHDAKSASESFGLSPLVVAQFLDKYSQFAIRQNMAGVTRKSVIMEKFLVENEIPEEIKLYFVSEFVFHAIEEVTKNNPLTQLFKKIEQSVELHKASKN